MGSAYSVDDLQWNVEKLTEQVENFDGTSTSTRYLNLQGELIQTNAAILKLKKSKGSKSSKQCDKMLVQLNLCLNKLTSKVTNNISSSDGPEEFFRDSGKKPPKRDLEEALLNFENEVDKLEAEIDNVIGIKDKVQSAILEGKLKLFFVDLSMIKIENETPFVSRKNAILQRLVRCHKKIKRHGPNTNSRLNDTDAPLSEESNIPHVDYYDSDLASDFDSDFDNGSHTSRSRHQSNRSTFEEPIYANMEIILQERQKRLEALPRSECTESSDSDDSIDVSLAILKMPPKKTLPPRTRDLPILMPVPRSETESDAEEHTDSRSKRKIYPPVPLYNDIKDGSVSVSHSEPESDIDEFSNSPIALNNDIEEDLSVLSYSETNQGVEENLGADAFVIAKEDFDTHGDEEENDSNSKQVNLPATTYNLCQQNSLGDDDLLDEDFCSSDEDNCEENHIEALSPLLSNEKVEFLDSSDFWHSEATSSSLGTGMQETTNNEKVCCANKPLIPHFERAEKCKVDLKRSVSSVDCTQKINGIMQQVEELKILNEKYKETQCNDTYSEMQEKLVKIIKNMFSINRTKFDKKSLIVYEIVSQDIQKFMNELD